MVSKRSDGSGQPPAAEGAAGPATGEPGRNRAERTAEDTEGVALSGLLGANPEAVLGAWQAFAAQLGKEPETALRQQFAYQAELARIWLGDVADEVPDDPRFADPAWRDDPVFRRLRQSWHAWTLHLDAWLDASGLEGIERQRGAFLLEIAKEIHAPVNSPWTPETIRRAIETRGQSLVRGIGNFLDDQQHNHGYPAIADRKAFTVGVDVAPTAGKVVYRDELMETIRI